MEEGAKAGPRLSSIEPGTVIARRFEVRQRLGSGGMGMVYRVIDRELDEVVALKLLHQHLAEDETVFRRFRNEVLVARALSHPNIVRTHDIGRAEEGFSYISMEFVDGVSLRDRLSSETGETIIGSPTFPLGFEEAVSILYQILSGVSYAHGKGVVHRDLKPANVLISKLGEVKLADFGTARIIGMDTSITRTGQVVGTPDYMSPEQIRGESLDHVCDIYALGIIAYELVHGVRPFNADSPVAVAFKHLNEPLPPFLNPDVPEWYQKIVLRASAKKREERFATVGEMAAAVLEGMPSVGRQSGYFSVEGTYFFGTSSTPAIGSSATPGPTAVNAGEKVEEKQAEGLAERRNEPEEERGFELGTDKHAQSGEWTLSLEEMSELDSVPGVLDTSTAKRYRSEGKRGLSALTIALLTIFLIAAAFGAVLTYLPGADAKFWAWLDSFRPDSLQQHQQRPAADSTDLQEQRRELAGELIALAGSEKVTAPEASSQTPASETPAAGKEATASTEAKVPAEAKVPKDSKSNGAPAAADAEAVKTDGSKAAAAAATAEQPQPPAEPADSGKQVAKEKEPPEKEQTAPAEPPQESEAEPEPAPQLTASAVLTLQQSGSPIGQGVPVSVDRLSSVTWRAAINGIDLRGVSAAAARAKEREIAGNLKLNLFDPAGLRVISRAVPRRVAAELGENAARATGDLSEFKNARPQAGNYRVDLVYNGEVLASQNIALYLARVSSPPAASAAAGGQISIVRGPSVVGGSELPAAPDLPDTTRPAAPPPMRLPEPEPPSASTDPALPAGSGATAMEPINDFNRPSSGLPPAKGHTAAPAPQVPPTADSQLAPPGVDTLAAFRGEHPQQPPAAVEVARERFAGTLSTIDESGRIQSRAMILQLSFNGSSIAGEASLPGYDTFSVSGRVLPRGIELELRNAQAQLRLTGVRRDSSLRGRYAIAGTKTRGRWEVTQTGPR